MRPEWRGGAGPHGGILAAILLRALTAAVDDPARAPRSLTIHFPRPPAEREVTIATAVERTGRSLTTTSARMTQPGEDGAERLVALALAAFSSAREAPTLGAARSPAEGAPTDAPDVPYGGTPRPRMFANLEARPVTGPPFTAGEEARSAAWMRPRVPAPLDAPTVAYLLDALWPAIFARIDRPAGIPTIDLTIHFRRSLPVPGTGLGAWAFGEFTTREVTEGFLDEEGMLWSEDGLLLAQSRQLALLVPMREG